MRGELKCDPTPAGQALFTPGAEFGYRLGATEASLTLAAVRPHKGRLLVRVRGVDDAESAARYIGAVLYADRARLDVGPGEYLDADLIGARVVSLADDDLGRVDEVLHYPASDLLVVDGKMIPMVRAIVREIDLKGGRVVIDPPPGLLD